MNDSMATQQDQTFIDRFNFHLAKNLLGNNQLEEFGMSSQRSQKANDDNPSSSSLCWRSKIALDNDNSELLQDGSKLTEKLLFLDVTFDLIFHDDDETLHLTSQFGFFLWNESTSHYVRGGRLTLAQLEEHAQGVGIDLHSAPPEAMAGIMARALLSSNNTAKKATVKLRDNKHHLVFSLYYSDVDESGVLTLDIEAKTSQFDALGVSLLVQSVGQLDRRDEDNKKKDDRVNVESFDTWFEQVRAYFLEQYRASNAEKTNEMRTGPPAGSPSATTSTSKDDKNPAARERKPKPPVPQAYHYAKVSNKRRKKSKLSFAVQG